jgi:hypothetical protein
MEELMHVADLPRDVLHKLMDLESDAVAAQAVLERRQREREAVRARLNASLSVAEQNELKIQFQAACDACGEATREFELFNSAHSRCRSWIAALANDATLEIVNPDVDELSLADVQQQLAQVEAELAELRSAPVPSADIAERIRAYVDSLVKLPKVSGIGAGEQLSVKWPQPSNGLEFNGRVTYGDNPDALSLLALIAPQNLETMLLSVVEHMGNQPLPPDQRPARIDALESERESLQREAAALGDLSMPAWCLLSVQLAPDETNAVEADNADVAVVEERKEFVAA